MKDKIIIELSDGTRKIVTVPAFGSINITVQNEKIYKIDVNQSEIIKTK